LFSSIINLRFYCLLSISYLYIFICQFNRDLQQTQSHASCGFMGQ